MDLQKSLRYNYKKFEIWDYNRFEIWNSKKF